MAGMQVLTKCKRTLLRITKGHRGGGFQSPTFRQSQRSFFMFADTTFVAIRWWYHSTWQAQVRTLGELTFGSFLVRYIDFVGFLESLSSDPLKHWATMSFARTIQNHVRMFWGGALLGGWLVSGEAWMEPMLQPMLSSTFLSSKQTISIAWVVDLSSCLSSTSFFRLVFKWTKNEFHSLLGSVSTLTKRIFYFIFFKKWIRFLILKLYTFFIFYYNILIWAVKLFRV